MAMFGAKIAQKHARGLTPWEPSLSGEELR